MARREITVGVVDTIEVVGWDPPHRVTVRHIGRVVRGSGVFAVVERTGDDGAEAATFSMSEQLDLPLGSLDALARQCEEIAAR